MEETLYSYVEGVSNPVFYLAICVSIFLVLLTIWFRQSSQNNVIHPNYHEQIQALRERILNRDAEPGRQRNAHRDDQCPICIDHYTFPVETNCGHVFCSSCVMSYYEHGNWIDAMSCPVCRQQVNVLLPDFSHEEQSSNEAGHHINKIRTYNGRYSGEPRPLWDYIMDFPVLARHLARNFFSISGLVVMFRLRIIWYLLIIIVYIVCPLDIMPEAVLGFLGLFDDIAVAAFVLVYLTVLFRQSLANA